MKFWLLFILALLAAILFAGCAGNDWVSPADLARAIAGDSDIRSRLLLEWRLPRVLAATSCLQPKFRSAF